MHFHARLLVVIETCHFDHWRFHFNKYQISSYSHVFLQQIKLG